MSEQEPRAELPRITKDQVIAEFRKFIDRGITNPDDLPLEDPEVIQANRLLDDWHAQEYKVAEQQGTDEADLQFRLDRSTIYVDAGFTDPDYLEEVVYEWMLEDILTARSLGNREMAKKILIKAKEVRALIPRKQ